MAYTTYNRRPILNKRRKAKQRKEAIARFVEDALCLVVLVVTLVSVLFMGYGIGQGLQGIAQ